METIWGITGIGVPGIFFLGLGLMTLPQSPPFAARPCFCTSALWAVVVGLVWLVTTPASWWGRIAAGMALGAFVFVVVPQMIRLTYAQISPPSELALPHDNTIVGHVPRGALGSDNTIVDDSDTNGNVIHNKTEAIG